VRRLARWDALRRSFWFLPGVAMVVAAVLGWAIPTVAEPIRLDLGIVSFSEADTVRSLLQTIATVTVTVIGISFSVTVVALQLASQQLGPRVLRTFEGEPINKLVLSVFLGLFVYCIVVLTTLRPGEGDTVPELGVTVAIVASIGAFGLFVAFIHATVQSLQASTLIKRIAADGHRAIEGRFPAGIGADPDDPAAATRSAQDRMQGSGTVVTATRAGFLTLVDGDAIEATAVEHDLLVRQVARLGDFVVTGTPLAQVWSQREPDAERIQELLAPAFRLGSERTVVQDVAFSVRQLADVALRALSPSLNDPTTAENAMGSLADTLIVFARTDCAPRVRVDADGRPWFVADAPDLDDLVRLGFEQVRAASAHHPVVAARLLELLSAIDLAAAHSGTRSAEAARQSDLLESAAR